jgi:hypothetical protein
MRIATGTVVLLVLLTACQRRQSLMLSEPSAKAEADGYLNGDRDYKASSQVSFTSNNQSPIATERKLIKTGSIDFEVDNAVKTKASIAGLVKEFNGYISSDEQNNYSGATRYSQVARIPSDKLDDFLAKVEGLAKNVDAKNISTQDVTEEFIDVETRLSTKKELEARYHQILKQAKTVKDILEVETQLNNVRAEIESMEGRLKYLTNQTSFSTLTITFYQTISGNYGFTYRFFSSFGNGWDNLLDFIIGLLNAWPFVIIVGAVVWFFIRWRRKRKLTAS